MVAVLASFVILGVVVGGIFAFFFAHEVKSSRANLESKTAATDRVARLAHNLDAQTGQPTTRS